MKPVFFLVIFLLLLGSSSFGGEVIPPAAVRAVSVHAYELRNESNEIEAQKRKQIKEDLSVRGYSPVWEKVVDEGKLGVWSYLLVGKHENLPDTKITKIWLRKDGYPDAYEMAFRNTEKTEFVTNVKIPRARRLVESGSNKNQLSISNIPEKYLSLATSLKAQDVTVLDKAREMISAMDENDPLRAHLILLCCQTEMVDHTYFTQFPIYKKTDEVLYSNIEQKQIASLTSIANGTLMATRRDQAEAAFTVAQIYHEYAINKLRAYDFINEILAEYTDDESIQIRANVMKAALLLELARSDTAYFNEVRRQCSIILNNFPDGYTNAKSVADLMYWESYLFEGKPEIGMEKLATFAKRYPNCPREIIAANYQAALCAERLEKYDLALEYLLRNFEINIPENKMMRWAGSEMNISAISNQRLLSVAEKAGKLTDEIKEIYKENASGEQKNYRQFHYDYLEEKEHDN